MRKSIITGLTALFVALLCKPVAGQMHAFELNQVKLKPSPFQNARDIDLKYILALDPDRLLAPYRIDAGLPEKSPRYGNWESIGLDGHIAGHYLSALAMMYASTGNNELKKRLDYMVADLAACQEKNGNGYVGGIPQGKVFWDRIHKGDIDGSGFGLNNTWVPFYNIHKLFAGLRDTWTITGNQQAKTVLIKLSEWLIELIRPLNDQQIQQILRTEHGGINETLADVYEITKDPKYLEAAKRFSHLAILEPLIKKEDKLTGLHANTQIPKVIGFEKVAQLTENKDWSDAAKYFWKNVSQERSVAFGGNSVREHFNPKNDFSSMLKSNQGPETCNSFNMLRLSKALFLDNSDPSYLDFYERTMYNHILSSQHPEKGGFVYFTPIRPNHYRVYSQPETSMWCCVGSGLENHTKYGELIYSHENDNLFVNFFIASELNWKEKGLLIAQNTNFPYENSSNLDIKLKKAKTFGLGIRKPSWAENFEIFVNDKLQKDYTNHQNYLIIKRNWKNGDRVNIRFNTFIRTETLPDGSNWVAFMNGPIVLAAKTSGKDLDGLFADDSRMGHEAKGRLIPINDAFALVGDKNKILERPQVISRLNYKLDSLQLQPFFEIHDSRYQMYFQVFSDSEYNNLKETRRKEEAEYLALEAITIDKVNCGEQQPEVDHDFKGEKSFSGNEEGLFWRSTRGYFSYNLKNKNRKGNKLILEAIEPLDSKNFDIYINENLISDFMIEGKKMTILKEFSDDFQIKITAKKDKPSPRFSIIRLVSL